MDAVLRPLAAYALQVLVVVLTAGVGAGLLRRSAPQLRLAYWRVVVSGCLLLWLTPPRVVEVEFAPVRAVVSAAVESTSVAPSAAAQVAWSSLVVWLIVAGIAARMLWLALGFVRLRALRDQGASAALDEELCVLQRTIAPDADIRWHDAIDQPVTFGVRRPTILLPRRLRELGIELQRAALCHELLHASRRDWLATVVEEVVRSLFWFHPAFWWAIGRIQLSREETVDVMAVAITNSRKHYMQALLAFADAPDAVAAAGFVRRRQLSLRIRQLSKEITMSRTHLTLALAAVSALIVSSGWTVVSAFPMRTDVRLHAPASLPAGALTVRSNRRAEQSGQAGLISVDMRGADLRAVLGAFSKVTALEFVLDPTVHMTLDVALQNVPWDQALDLIMKEHGLTYAIDGKVVRVRLAAGAPSALAPPSVSAPSSPAQRDQTGISSPARKAVERINPSYPAAAAGTGITARVKVQITIAPDGGVVDAKAIDWSLVIDRDISDPNYWANKPQQAFLDAAEEAARRWRFEPNDPRSSVNIWFGFTEKRPDDKGAAVGGAARATVRVGGPIKPPQKVRDVKPAYPEAARAAGVSGVVILEVRLGADGSVADARVLRSVPMLDDAAVEAVRQWKFTPTLLNGEPVDVVMTVTVNFRAD